MKRSPFSERPDILMRSSPPWEIVTVTTCGLSVGNGETDCLELNLFATKQAFAEITQCDGKSESGKRTTRLNVYLFRHVLVLFADVCAGDSRQKICGEFTLRLSILRFFPGPFFLDQFWLLSKLRLFLIEFPVWELISDHYV